MKALHTAARTALTTSLKLNSAESFLVITDDVKKTIGEAFYLEGSVITRDVLMIVMPPSEVNGQEPPPAVAELMGKYRVVVCPTAKSLTHTEARRNACKAGSRVATMPGITEDCMIRTLKADYSKIAERTYRITDILDRGNLARITTDLGTDLTMPINGIKAIASTGLIDEPGKGGNLPSGESFLMPVEGTSHGVVFIDGSLAGIGTLAGQPVRVEIVDGYATRIDGGPEADMLRRQLDAFGKPGRNIAELGIGTNHEARITGMILEDEKVMGTIHIAFGNNITMGGTHDVGIHIDGVIKNPTVYIDDRMILDNGTLLVD